MMSKGNRRVWSRVGSRPSESTSLFLSSSSLYFISSAFHTRPLCTRPLHFPSRSIGWNERRTAFQTRIPVPSRSLCEYYSALHSRFFCREIPYRDAPLHLRVKMSIRSCFSTSSFLHKFSVSLRRDLLSSFVLVVLRRLQESKGETWHRYSCALEG